MRRAVTLVEVLLVLCLLVVLASIAWPALDRPFSNQRLRKSAEVVRFVWARARIEAMSSGQTLAFRYMIDGDRYSIQAYAGAESAPPSASDREPAAGSDYSNRPEFMLETEPVLPEGVTFFSSETEADARAESVASQEAVAGGLAGQSQVGWSDPIFFYPDGTTSTVRLVLKNEYGRCIELSLRGLTGVVTVGEPYSGEGK